VIVAPPRSYEEKYSRTVSAYGSATIVQVQSEFDAKSFAPLPSVNRPESVSDVLVAQEAWREEMRESRVSLLYLYTTLSSFLPFPPLFSFLPSPPSFSLAFLLSPSFSLLPSLPPPRLFSSPEFLPRFSALNFSTPFPFPQIGFLNNILPVDVKKKLAVQPLKAMLLSFCHCQNRDDPDDVNELEKCEREWVVELRGWGGKYVLAWIFS